MGWALEKVKEEVNLPVSNPLPQHGRTGLCGTKRGEGDAVAGMALIPHGGEVDDADIGAGGCRALEDRHEGADEHGVAHMVCSELDLEAIGGERWCGSHDAGVVDENVKAGVGEVFGDCGRDRGEGGEIHLDKGQRRRRGYGGRERGQKGVCGRLGAAREVNMGGVVAEESDDCGFAQARCS